MRPTARNGRGSGASWRAAGRPRRSARLTRGSRRTGRGLVVVARLTGGRSAGRQPARSRRVLVDGMGARLERAPATPAVEARRTARPRRPALPAGTGPASRRGRSPTSRRGACLCIDRTTPPAVRVGGLGSRLRGRSVSPPPDRGTRLRPAQRTWSPRPRATCRGGRRAATTLARPRSSPASHRVEEAVLERGLRRGQFGTHE